MNLVPRVQNFNMWLSIKYSAAKIICTLSHVETTRQQRYSFKYAISAWERMRIFYDLYFHNVKIWEYIYISYAIFNVKCKFQEKNVSQFSCLGKLGRHGSVHSMHSKRIRLDEDLKLNSAKTCSNFL